MIQRRARAQSHARVVIAAPAIPTHAANFDHFASCADYDLTPSETRSFGLAGAIEPSADASHDDVVTVRAV
jgi:hypothetical protein